MKGLSLCYSFFVHVSFLVNGNKWKIVRSGDVYIHARAILMWGFFFPWVAHSMLLHYLKPWMELCSLSEHDSSGHWGFPFEAKAQKNLYFPVLERESMLLQYSCCTKALSSVNPQGKMAALRSDLPHPFNRALKDLFRLNSSQLWGMAQQLWEVERLSSG